MKWTFALSLLLLAGCLKPDATGPGQPPIGSGIEDQNLMAGATSSTNWPPEDAGDYPLAIQGTGDSTLEVRFFEVISQQPLTLAPVKLSGNITLYMAGKIPALDEVERVNAHFSNSDTYSVSPLFLASLVGSPQDTVTFSIHVEVGENQSLISGFTYSSKLKKFIKSPFSENPKNSYPLTPPRYYLHGIADSTLTSKGDSAQGKIEWCFYIPGSPYFFKVLDNDTGISIGPLPSGQFPIRLLRIVGSNETSHDRLEVYEVKAKAGELNSVRHSPYYVIWAGEMLFTSDLKSSVPIRSRSP